MTSRGRPVAGPGGRGWGTGARLGLEVEPAGEGQEQRGHLGVWPERLTGRSSVGGTGWAVGAAGCGGASLPTGPMSCRGDAGRSQEFGSCPTCIKKQNKNGARGGSGSGRQVPRAGMLRCRVVWSAASHSARPFGNGLLVTRPSLSSPCWRGSCPSVTLWGAGPAPVFVHLGAEGCREWEVP